MRKIISVILIALGFAGLMTGTAGAQHYVNGIEGIRAATLPPPGFYYRMYNVLYQADTMTDPEGDDLNIDFDVTVFANVHRFIWVSDYKILGADYATNVIVPLVSTNIEIGAKGVDDREFSAGDVFWEPVILAWHGARYDAVATVGVFFPTADDDKPASPGKDMWTGMCTLGGTVYFDAEKTWSASILSRYEIHSEKEGPSDVTPGDDFHFEWGIAKHVGKLWDFGLTGYCQWQVSEDTGTGTTDDKDKVFAVGPEAMVLIPSAKLFVSLRSQWEFGAEDRTEGNATTLTFTKIF